MFRGLQEKVLHGQRPVVGKLHVLQGGFVFVVPYFH